MDLFSDEGRVLKKQEGLRIGGRKGSCQLRVPEETSGNGTRNRVGRLNLGQVGGECLFFC